MEHSYLVQYVTGTIGITANNFALVDSNDCIRGILSTYFALLLLKGYNKERRHRCGTSPTDCDWILSYDCILKPSNAFFDRSKYSFWWSSLLLIITTINRMLGSGVEPAKWWSTMYCMQQKFCQRKAQSWLGGRSSGRSFIPRLLILSIGYLFTS